MSRFIPFFFERSYQNLLKPVLFRFDPEAVHDRICELGTKLGQHKATRMLTRLLLDFEHPCLEQKIAGVRFRNPVGLSAGFDKDANLVSIIPEVGFGFMEVGTITLHPYGGNPKPRLWRLPKSKALVVNYGLKSIGAKRIVQKLRGFSRPNFALGLSVGMTNSQKTSTVTEGVDDYYTCLKTLKAVRAAKFYVINISCPNTFGGEPFTTKVKLEKLLTKLGKLKVKKPVLVKMPINLAWKEFEPLLKVCVKARVAGVVIGNLNKDHSSPLLKDPIPADLKGGISGLPTQKLSNELIGHTFQKYGSKLIIVGVGGIFSAEDAYRKIRLGASLVALVTGMVYSGPQLIGQINSGLVELLQKDGFGHISEAVGADFHRYANQDWESGFQVFDRLRQKTKPMDQAEIAKTVDRAVVEVRTKKSA